ncbi:Protein phosphatase 2C (PP2C)-like domain [Pseudocohnilembus persalinus]|uniref:protein-serine/threonine phosphatase n=1 Tax=Pseudocohnilembus persalinus TaxID=266149 RepID=A0A0V0QNN6_PSEPJ|nr:Protein phosphatase 2C (PP2C)-like domain [Pseudocohnilembus persalinus]|eukprot:KRX03971.1 Protein phosphatase 2C (PP2C)-like domain [Pseudocohnilembus persalinus]
MKEYSNFDTQYNKKYDNLNDTGFYSTKNSNAQKTNFISSNLQQSISEQKPKKQQQSSDLTFFKSEKNQSNKENYKILQKKEENIIEVDKFEQREISERKYNKIKSFASLSHQGIHRNYNEDRVKIITNLQKPSFKQGTYYWPDIHYFAIFDGHGGVKCADFLQQNLHNYILQQSDFPQFPYQAIQKGVIQAENEFLAQADRNQDNSGSCALVAIFIDAFVYIVNIGDSRAILSQNLGKEIQNLSNDHKPELEIDRIEQAGGEVYQSKENFKDYYFYNGVKYDIPYRVKPGRLSVSRTIGDKHAKMQKYGGNPNAVIAKPEISVFKLEDNYDFIVLGCDGVFDRLKSEQIIDNIWYQLKKQVISQNCQEQTNFHSFTDKCSQSILEQSMHSKSLDNVTCIVISFENFQKEFIKKSTLQNINFFDIPTNEIKQGQNKLFSNNLEYQDFKKDIKNNNTQVQQNYFMQDDYDQQKYQKQNQNSGQNNDTQQTKQQKVSENQVYQNQSLQFDENSINQNKIKSKFTNQLKQRQKYSSLEKENIYFQQLSQQLKKDLQQKIILQENEQIQQNKSKNTSIQERDLNQSSNSLVPETFNSKNKYKDYQQFKSRKQNNIKQYQQQKLIHDALDQENNLNDEKYSLIQQLRIPVQKKQNYMMENYQNENSQIQQQNVTQKKQINIQPKQKNQKYHNQSQRNEQKKINHTYLRNPSQIRLMKNSYYTENGYKNNSFENLSSTNRFYLSGRQNYNNYNNQDHLLKKNYINKSSFQLAQENSNYSDIQSHEQNNYAKFNSICINRVDNEEKFIKNNSFIKYNMYY